MEMGREVPFFSVLFPGCPSCSFDDVITYIEELKKNNPKRAKTMTKFLEMLSGIIEEEDSALFPSSKFIWEKSAVASFHEEKDVPKRAIDYSVLCSILRVLKKVKNYGLEKAYRVIVIRSNHLILSPGELFLPLMVAEKVLGRKLRPKEEISFNEGLTVLEEIKRGWKEFLGEAEKKGWKKGKRFIWQFDDVEISLSSGLIPSSSASFSSLEDLVKRLEEIEEKGASEYVSIEVGGNDGFIEGDEYCLFLPPSLLEKALKKNYKRGEKVDIKEALKALHWLLDEWKNFKKEAKKKGWLQLKYSQNFLWEKKFHFMISSSSKLSDKERRKIEETKKWLEEIKERKAEHFVKIITIEGNAVICEEGTLFLPKELASQGLNKKIEEGRQLTLEEALKVFNKLLSPVNSP